VQCQKLHTQQHNNRHNTPHDSEHKDVSALLRQNVSLISATSKVNFVIFNNVHPVQHNKTDQKQ